MHLAELNISNWKVDPASPEAAGFVDNVARVNALAERSPGFVWRKIDEERDERGRNPVGGPKTLMTLSVWETSEHLEHFVWNTVHKKIFENKALWFSQMESHHLVMWWVKEGVPPTIQEAKDRLDHLNANGNTDYAFNWSYLPQNMMMQGQNHG